LICNNVFSKKIEFNFKSLDFNKTNNLNFNKMMTDSQDIKKLKYPIDYRFFHYQLGVQMGGVKFVNFGLNTQVYFQPVRFFSLTGGIDIQNFRLKIFSSSDKHIINTGTLPIYYGGLINLNNKLNNPKAYYIFAKKGISVGLGSESISANNHDYLEIGLGKTFKGNSTISFRLEASYQAYGLSGSAVSSYQSVIEYDLRYRSVLFRAALVFNKE
jgi:hypothetical protein